MTKVERSDAEWRQQLSPESYRVARQAGTERPFTGEYNDCKKDGVYRCVCCGQALFDAGDKFDSGSGWPSFWQPASGEAVAEHSDSSLGMVRTEVLCSACDAHLGHVFPDGPEPRACVTASIPRRCSLRNADQAPSPGIQRSSTVLMASRL